MNDLEPADAADSHLIEELVFRCLEAEDTGAAAESLCAEHPELAPRIRRVLSRLEAEGLVEETGDGDTLSAIGGEETEIPRQLGGFRLLSRLGSGGMGVVYLAEEKKLGRQVAIKLVRPDQLYFPGARARFQREIESIARLHHTGIVTIHTIGEEHGIPYFSMDYVRGLSLSQVVKNLAGHNPARLQAKNFYDQIDGAPAGDTGDSAPHGSWNMLVIQFIRDVADALAHAHAQGVLHRDVKPSNILVGPDRRPRLLDFGLAHSAGAQQITRTTSQLGSLPYMAPEQLAGEADSQAPTLDVYALGVTMYEFLTLRSPYLAARPEQTRANILAGTPPLPRHLNPSISLDVETLCLTAMDPDPARRYQSMPALIEDLDNILAHRPIVARPLGRALRAWRWIQRHPTAAVAIGMTAVLVGMVTAFALHQLAAARETERTNYVLGLTAAHAHLELHRFQEANESLALCPERLRGFEWRHLQLRSESSEMVYRGHTGRVWDVSCHPGGKQLVSGSLGNEVIIWDVDSSRPAKTIRVSPSRLGVSAVRYSGDGRFIFAGSSDGKIRRWQSDGTDPEVIFDDKETSIRVLVADDAGRYIASGSTDGRVRLFDVGTGSLAGDLAFAEESVQSRLSEIERPILALAFSADGRTLFASQLHNVFVFDVEQRRQVAKLDQGRQNWVMFLAPYRDGKRLLTGTMLGTAHLWNLETRVSIEDSEPVASLTCGIVSHDTGCVIVAGAEGLVYVGDAGTLHYRYTLTGHEGTVQSMVSSPDQSTFFTSSYDGTIRRWRTTARPAILALGKHPDGVRSLEITPDGRRAITGGKDGSLRSWDLAGGPVREVFSSTEAGIGSTSLAPDGRRLLFIADGTYLVDLSSGQPPRRLQDVPASVRCLAWLGGGDRFVGATGGQVILFEAAGRGVAQTQLTGKGFLGEVLVVRECPWNGKIVALSSRGKLAVMEPSLRVVRVIDVHEHPIMPTLGVDTLDRMVVTADRLGNIRFWDPDTGTRRSELVWENETVSSIEFSPDHERMITSSRSGQIQVWDRHRQAKLLLLRTMKADGGFSHTRFTPDGSRIVSVSVPGTVRVWDSRKR